MLRQDFCSIVWSVLRSCRLIDSGCLKVEVLAGTRGPGALSRGGIPLSPECNGDWINGI